MGSHPDAQYHIQRRKYEYRRSGKSNTKRFLLSLLFHITFTFIEDNYARMPIPTLRPGPTHYDTMSTDQEMALVGGLHPAVTYTFRMFAVNAIDASAPTDPVVAKTQEEGIAAKIYLIKIVIIHDHLFFQLQWILLKASTFRVLVPENWSSAGR